MDNTALTNISLGDLIRILEDMSLKGVSREFEIKINGDDDFDIKSKPIPPVSLTYTYMS